MIEKKKKNKQEEKRETLKEYSSTFMFLGLY